MKLAQMNMSPPPPKQPVVEGCSGKKKNAPFLLLAVLGLGLAACQSGGDEINVAAARELGRGFDQPDIELADTPTVAVDWSKGAVQYITLGGNRSFTFLNGRKSGRYFLVITQDAVGSRLVTWPSSVRWPGSPEGEAPVLTTTAHKTDYVTFFYNGNTNTYDMLGLAQNYGGKRAQ